MEKVKKKIQKEIRVTFNLNNEVDKELYDKLKGFTQPSKIIKQILLKNLDNEGTIDNSSNENSNVNYELIKVINKLSDKIDNLTLIPSQNSDKKEEKVKELSFTAEVSSEDLNDLDF